MASAARAGAMACWAARCSSRRKSCESRAQQQAVPEARGTAGSRRQQLALPQHSRGFVGAAAEPLLLPKTRLGVAAKAATGDNTYWITVGQAVGLVALMAGSAVGAGFVISWRLDEEGEEALANAEEVEEGGAGRTREVSQNGAKPTEQVRNRPVRKEYDVPAESD
eukprot:SM000031S11515  [mRNA]  locus=s31:138371:139266:+ [translate_table: standard]